jgi:hypothetical protein
VTTLAEYLDPTDVTTAVGNLLGLRDYLGAAASEDTLLTSWYSAAIGWCDQKLSSRDFVDSTGADEDPPDTVVLGVYEFVRVMRDYSKRPGAGIKKTKTGAREEEFFEAGTAGRVTAAGIAAWPYLEPYCEDVTLFASGGA